MNHILVNGIECSTVNILDRGFQYGDGLFETIRVLDGKPVLWSPHWLRLAAGCERMGIAAPDESVLMDDLHSVAASKSGIIKIIVSRGVGLRGYRAPEISNPTRVVQFVEDEPDVKVELQSIELMICQIRLANQPALAGIKHLNRLEQILAQKECAQHGVLDGLMCGQNGSVVESTHANLFWVQEGEIFTPWISGCGVRGVMRDYLISQVKVTESNITPNELKEVDELFLTNSVFGVRSVHKLDNALFGRQEKARDCFETLRKEGLI